MTFDKSPFAQSLYKSGTPQRPTQPNSPKTSQISMLSEVSHLGRTSSPTASSTSPKTPTTPNAFRPSSPSTIPTGSWIHPAYRQIQKRTVNKEKIVKRVLINVGVFIILYMSGEILADIAFFNSLMVSLPEIRKWMAIAMIGFQCILVYNVGQGLWRLVQSQDRFEDLALTPSQRRLFGLPESSKPSPKVTPSPPKYMKSSPQTRISPRPSPLGRSFSASSGSPLARLSSPSRVGAGSSPNSSSSSSVTRGSVESTMKKSNSGLYKATDKTSMGSPHELSKAVPNGGGTSGTSGTSASRVVSKPTLISNDSPDTPTPVQKTSVPSFTPSSRFKYMSETPRRRSIR